MDKETELLVQRLMLANSAERETIYKALFEINKNRVDVLESKLEDVRAMLDDPYLPDYIYWKLREILKP